MSATGLPVFDATLQKTNIWLDEISEVLGVNRHQAWGVLSAGLRSIRERLPVELAAHLGAQLPLLVRGTYYDQFRPAGQPLGYRTWEEFVQQMSSHLPATFDVDAGKAATAVFGVVTRHVTPEQVSKVRHALPEEVREHWPEAMPLGHPIVG